jgi:hypothetical protein
MAQDWIFYPPPEPTQGPRKIAPLTIATGDQPPRKAALALSAALCIAAWNPPDPPPLQKKVQIAPLTLTYGQKPPNIGAATPQELLLYRMAWEPPANAAQTESNNAGWNVPAVVVPVVPYAQGWRNTVIQSWLPPDPAPLQKPVTAATQGLAIGDQPPNVGAMTAPEFSVIRAAWEPGPNPAQSEAPNAAWNVPPPIVSQPIPFYQPWLPTVLLSWQPEPPLPKQLPPLQIVDNTPVNGGAGEYKKKRDVQLKAKLHWQSLQGEVPVDVAVASVPDKQKPQKVKMVKASTESLIALQEELAAQRRKRDDEEFLLL